MSMDAVTEFVGNMIGTIFGSRSAKIIKRLVGRVEAINALEARISKFTDAQLKERTLAFRAEIAALRAKDPKADANGKIEAYLDSIMHEAYALVREASKRTLGMRHFDVQLIGGMVLHKCTIAEMVTGEGKTLVATLPCYLNALPRRPHEYAYVHVVTVNDYLARRDADWNRPVFELLGLTCGSIQSNMDSWERHPIYASDIVYGTNSEFGFDYLRDNMKPEAERQVQQVRHFAIIDEVDSILIDEARTPLIISGPPEKGEIEKFNVAARLAAHLKRVPEEEQERVENLRLQGAFEEAREGHYMVDEKDHSVALTQAGIAECERFLKIDNFYTGQHMDWPHFINNALKAKELYKKGKEYEVAPGREGKLEVLIVDEFTGRMMYGRRWSDGLHQSVEAKEILAGERLVLEAESQTLATVTIQNFFKLYKKLAGMTGTAVTESKEFGQIYKLEVASIPTNRPMRRLNHADVIYGTEKEKWDAVCEEIERYHAAGRPILVGTTSVEKSERLAGLLERRGYRDKFSVLNAKQHEKEALIVAKAGELGAITVATNMAGRGTDILLREFSYAGQIEFWQRTKLSDCDWFLAPRDFDAGRPLAEMQEHLDGYWAKHFLDEKVFKDTPQEKRRQALEKFWTERGIPHLKLARSVRELGGLHIVGTERHESRRIDNQLRGRSGRQGDPGSSRFFLCLDDDLMRIFAKDWVRNFLRRSGMKDGAAIESRLVSRSIEKAQRRVEEHNFGIRKRLLEYDEVMNEQRKLIYGLRQKVLEWQDLSETMTGWLEDVVALSVRAEAGGEDSPSTDTMRSIHQAVVKQFPVEARFEDLDGRPLQEVEDLFVRLVKEKYEAHDKELGEVDFPKSHLVNYSAEELALPPERRVEMVRRKLADLSGRPAQDLRLNEEPILNGMLPTTVESFRKVRKLRLIERFLLLDLIDTKWKEHLQNMDVLREGIHLRGYAQKDPKLEYKREGFSLFEEMFNSMKAQAAGMLFRLQLSEEIAKQEVQNVWNLDEAETVKEEAKSAFETAAPAAGGSEEMAAQSEHGGSDVKAIETIRRSGKRILPNEPCPCGSGKKFKKCHGRFGDMDGGDQGADAASEMRGKAKMGG
ncbi:MAG: preprotein translocase subunit SecA [Planctomycetota bacterium]|nr:preprotein translocase subunit SecA [Planctomycetota bacterium]